MLHFEVLSHTNTYSWLAFAPILFCAGFGLGTTAGPLFQIALSGASDDDTGSASGASRAIQQVGSAFGIAIMGGLFFSKLGDASPGAHEAYSISDGHRALLHDQRIPDSCISGVSTSDRCRSVRKVIVLTVVTVFEVEMVNPPVTSGNFPS